MSVYDVYKDYKAQPSTYTQAYGNNNQPPQQQGLPASQGVGAHYAPSPTPIWNPQTQQWQLPDGSTPQTMSTMPVANPQAIGAHYAPAPTPQFNKKLMRWEGEGEDTMNTLPADQAYDFGEFDSLSEDQRLKFGDTGWLRQQMTDDRGLFQGGDEGRVFGRMRDWWEDKVMGGGSPSTREDGLVVADDFK